MLELNASGGGEARPRGRMIAVCSAKGGIGRTVTAVNLAVALAKSKLRVALLDGNLQFGDVCLAMDIHPAFTVKDVAEGIHAMDAQTLESYLAAHSSGVSVLAAPVRPEHADLIAPGALERICELMLERFDYLIVDTEVGLQERTLPFTEKADRILLLATPEMAAIKNAKLFLDTLGVLGLRDKASVVLNRSTMQSLIRTADIPELLGIGAFVEVPNDFQLMSRSLNIGVPFVQGRGASEQAKAMFRMAERLIAGHDPAQQPGGRTERRPLWLRRKKSGLLHQT